MTKKTRKKLSKTVDHDIVGELVRQETAPNLVDIAFPWVVVFCFGMFCAYLTSLLAR